MKQIDPSQLLAQLRATAAMAQGIPGIAATPVNTTTNFSVLLKESIDSVNALQKTSGSLAESFERGNQKISLEEVMIAKQKANISFQAMLKVRNELISAYKEVMSMPL